MTTRLEYISGKASGLGLEIGPFCEVWPTPSNVEEMRYADKRTRAELIAWAKADTAVSKTFNEARVPEIVYVTDGERLNPIADKTFDFVLVSHVLEHCRDPIRAIQNWVRVVKPLGRVFMAVPDFRQCFDKDRHATPINLLVGRYNDGRFAQNPAFARSALDFDRIRIRDYLSLVGKLSGKALDTETERILDSGEDLHFNCFGFETFAPFLASALNSITFALHVPSPFVIEDHRHVGGEFLATLRRTGELRR